MNQITSRTWSIHFLPGIRRKLFAAFIIQQPRRHGRVERINESDDKIIEILLELRI